MGLANIHPTSKSQQTWDLLSFSSFSYWFLYQRRAKIAAIFGRITLVDRTAEVLPLLPPDARDYARKWLEGKGLELRLGQELPLEQPQLLRALGIEEALVLPCAGVRFPGGQLVAKLGAGDATGQICTNRAMQCVGEGGNNGEQMEL